MSEQPESQEIQAPYSEQPEEGQSVAPESQLAGNEQGDDDQYHQQAHNYNAANNYSQRGAKNGRQGQPRGGRYGSNKYNYNNNNNNASGQYNRFNNNGTGANTRNYNNGYKPHRRNMNPMAMNMQWQGYYNPQMYYMASQLAPGTPGASMDIPQATSPIQPAVSSASPPAPKKIEITTKTGEHLDLSALHAHNTNGSSTNTASNVVQKSNDSTNTSSLASVGTTSSSIAPNSNLDVPVETKKDGESANLSEKTVSEAEKTKREFLEQIKLRKAALEKKKLQQSESSKTKTEPQQEQKSAEEAIISPASTSKQVDSNENVETPDESGEVTKIQNSEEVNKSTDVSNEKESITVGEGVEGADDTEKPASGASVEDENVEKETDIAAPKDSSNEDPAKPVFDETEKTIEETTEKTEEASLETATAGEETSEKPAGIPMTQFLETLTNAKPIDDIYSFKYPEGIEGPDARYQKAHIKYTYGPAFLLQFKDRIKTSPDEEWTKQTASKIVIPPGMNKAGRQRDGSSFGGPGGRMNGGDFRKSGSMRNMDGRSSSRNSSKKKSKRMMDDRRSNRSYTSRRDRERAAEMERKENDKPKEEVAPLVPSANRWVPKSKQKKTEKKLAPDGVTELLDKQEVERNMKSLLNKLTLEMFDKISGDILTIAHQSKWETNGETLSIVIEQIFIKACDEPHWSSMYAQLCGKVVKELDPEIIDENNEGKKGPKLVLHYLVARCHTEFDKGWTDKLPTNEDGTPIEPEMMSDEYYKAAAAKRRGLGLVRFIGFLYRLNLLTGKMMFECFRRLMKDLSNNPSEETLESVVELLSTVGEQFETDSFSAGQATLEGSALLDSLFANLQGIIESASISSRMKFKLIDIRELREDKHWNSNKKDDGPKTIQQIHNEEKERQQQKNNNSRSNSRRVNNSMGGRNTSRREAPTISKDNFITTRSSSLRHTQKPVQKEESRQPQMTATNMFSALMDSNDDDE